MRLIAPSAKMQTTCPCRSSSWARAREAATSLGSYETFAEFQLLLRAGDVLIPKVDFAEPCSPDSTITG